VAYVVEEGRAVRRVVKLGAVVDTQAVVQDGLRPGDRVVVEGQRLATDGISVKVMP
jgi:multidrug efflux pump subunit AcrA (membrane-fusion protein)